MPADTLLRAVTAVRTAQDYVKLPGYNHLIPAGAEVAPAAAPREYQDNWQFWQDVLGYSGQTTLRRGERVILKGFTLSPWVPRVPGLYWKVESGKLRESAQVEMINPRLYNPVGKTRQVLGGIGNVRLLPTTTGRLVCASSSGQYWQGLPLLLQGDAWKAHRDDPLEFIADVQATWTLMPEEYARDLGSDSGIPRCCLLAEEVTDVEPTGTGYGGRVGAWTLFEYRNTDNLIEYSFVYATFNVEPEDTAGNGRATEFPTGFLEEYVKKFHGQILTDFDEEIPHFDAMLPVTELMSQQVDQRRLRGFVDYVKKRALAPDMVKYDKLPQILMQKFNTEELVLLALDYAGLKLEQLVGANAGLADHVDALMDYCRQQDKLEELVVGVVQQRPQVEYELTAIT